MRLLEGPQAFQVFTDYKAAVDPVYPGQKYGTLAQHRGSLRSINRRGGGIFFSVNQTDGTGRKTANITRVRAYVIDCDGLRTSAAKNARIERIYRSGLQPSALIETRNGIHAYWYSRGDEGVDPQAYRRLNRRLAHHYGGDPIATPITTVLRVPGFLHQKDPSDPFTIKLIHEDPDLYYTPEELLEVYPEAPAEQRAPARDNEPVRLSAAAGPRAHAYLSAALANQTNQVRETTEGQRNAELNKAAFSLGRLTNVDGFDPDAVAHALLGAALDAGLDEPEARTTIRSGLDAGMKRPRPIVLNAQEAPR